jgi:hypothetical protein
VKQTTQARTNTPSTQTHRLQEIIETNRGIKGKTSVMCPSCVRRLSVYPTQQNAGSQS